MKNFSYSKKADFVADWALGILAIMGIVLFFVIALYWAVLDRTGDSIDQSECQAHILLASNYIENGRATEFSRILTEVCFKEETIDVISQEDFVRELTHCKEVASQLSQKADMFIERKVNKCFSCVKLAIKNEVPITKFHLEENNRGDEGIMFKGSQSLENSVLVPGESIVLYMTFQEEIVEFSTSAPSESCSFNS